MIEAITEWLSVELGISPTLFVILFILLVLSLWEGTRTWRLTRKLKKDYKKKHGHDFGETKGE